MEIGGVDDGGDTVDHMWDYTVGCFWRLLCTEIA